MKKKTFLFSDSYISNSYISGTKWLRHHIKYSCKTLIVAPFLSRSVPPGVREKTWGQVPPFPLVLKGPKHARSNRVNSTPSWKTARPKFPYVLKIWNWLVRKMGQSALIGTKKSGNGSEAEGGLKRRARRATVTATKRPMQSGKRRTGRTGHFSSYIWICASGNSTMLWRLWYDMYTSVLDDWQSHLWNGSTWFPGPDFL